MKFFPTSVFLSVILLLACGCATMPRQADMKDLKTKAEEYWNLRMQDRYEDTYKMEDGDGLPSFEDYKSRAALIKKFDIESHSIGRIKADGAEATLDVDFAFRVRDARPLFHDTIHDKWVFKDGRWYHRFK
jgi:hypothetical protein